MNTKPYDREAALRYARTWAFKRNPSYYDFSKEGGDCTNFASQVLYAGSAVMNHTPTFGWYYYSAGRRAPAWSGVPYFYQFLTKNQGPGPFGEEVGIQQVEVGDFVQLSETGTQFTHTLVITHRGEEPHPSNILVAAHSYDAYDKPLMLYAQGIRRYLHINGVYTN